MESRIVQIPGRMRSPSSLIAAVWLATAVSTPASGDPLVPFAPPSPAPAPALSGACGQDDSIGNNDTCALGHPVVAGTLSDLFVEKADDDWFRVSVPVFSTVYVQAIFAHGGGDIDLRMFDACEGTEIDNSLSTGDNEQVSLRTFGTPREVLVLVEVFDGSVRDCNLYDLVVSIEPGTPGTSFCPANVNSSGFIARAVGNGSSSYSANDLTLLFGPVPSGVPGIVFHSDRQVLVPFGTKFRCVGLPLRRSTILMANGTNMIFPVDTQAWPEIQQGSQRYFQCWFRDGGDPEAFGVSGAYAVTFTE